MSAFLGPIHVKMYGRVLYQDEMAQALLAFAEKKGWANGLRDLADAKASAASKEPLDTLIDQGNIHGWLNDAVSRCEQRFAVVANGILAGHPERLGELEGVMKDLGQHCGLPQQPDAERAFEAIHNILLDGMPCDFPFYVAESSPALTVWQVATCPHAPYWQAEKGDVDTYYLLRDAWVDGALSDSGIVHTRIHGTHTLRKEH